MAIKPNVLLALLCVSLGSPVLTRVLIPNPRATTLDVAKSIRKTRIAMADSDLGEIKESEREDPTEYDEWFGPSDLVVEVRPRQGRSSFPDYASLTSARLARDSARVTSILGRLDSEAPVSSGASRGSGEYFSRVGVGQPPQPVEMVLDTGSDITWLQAQPCVHCYPQSNPLFLPSKSSTYAPVGCDASQCMSLDGSSCRTGRCQYEVSYGDRSFSTGDLVTETVTLGRAAADNITIGSGHDNEGLFKGAGGLLGLGRGALSFPTQLRARGFSYCLVDRDTSLSSTLEFHTTAEPSITPGTVTANLLRDPGMDTFYFVDLTAVRVGGLNVAVPPFMAGISGGIVDSGTTITRLPPDVYDSIRDKFVDGTKHLRAAPAMSLFDTCFDLSSAGKNVSVPTVALVFSGGKAVDLPAENYMVPIDDEGTFCFAFAPSTSGLYIIGNVQQQGIRVTVDLAGNAMRFSPNSC